MYLPESISRLKEGRYLPCKGTGTEDILSKYGDKVIQIDPNFVEKEYQLSMIHPYQPTINRDVRKDKLNCSIMIARELHDSKEQ